MSRPTDGSAPSAAEETAAANGASPEWFNPFCRTSTAARSILFWTPNSPCWASRNFLGWSRRCTRQFRADRCRSRTNSRTSQSPTFDLEDLHLPKFILRTRKRRLSVKLGTRRTFGSRASALQTRETAPKFHSEGGRVAGPPSINTQTYKRR